MVLLNAINQETTQLKDFQKEANDFTTLPIPTFCYEENENQIKSLGGFSGQGLACTCLVYAYRSS